MSNFLMDIEQGTSGARTNALMGPNISQSIQSTKTWDIDFLRLFISEVEVKAIRDIPMGSFSRHDRLVWSGAKCGKYSINGGYHWIHSSRLMVGASNSLVPPNSEDMKARCNYVFNAITIVPSHVMHAISLSLVSFWEVQVPKSFISRSIIDSSRPDPRWCCPIAIYIKINVDASWSPVSGRTNLAAVLRDHEGQFVAAHKLSIVASSVVFVEAMAVLKGCELAAKLGLGWVVAESDSLKVVSSLNGDISNGSWETAYFLASRQNMEMCGNCWVRRPPSSLIHILNKDGLPCPP
ncbi:hypothetical protein ACFXTH_006190 [Malus domestica]